MSEAEGEYMVLVPELRPAIARLKEPVIDEDGYVTHHEVREHECLVHTTQVARGWVCEWEDGSVSVVPYENVRFADGEDE